MIMTMTMTKKRMKMMIIMIMMTIIKQINLRPKNPEPKMEKIQNRILINLLRQQMYITTERPKNIEQF